MASPWLAGYVFRLFVADAHTVASRQVATRVRALCAAHLGGRYELEVVDVGEHPDLAEEDQVVAVPTVIRVSPLPQSRVIGDLSDDVRTAAALGLPDPEEFDEERGQR